MFFSNLNSNCSNLLDMRNLQEQVKKAFCYQKLFWPFTVTINCSSDLKKFKNSQPSASNFKSFSRWLEQFFLTVGQNNFGNKIPNFLSWMINFDTLSGVFLSICMRIIGIKKRRYVTPIWEIILYFSLSITYISIWNKFQQKKSGFLTGSCHDSDGLFS